MLSDALSLESLRRQAMARLNLAPYYSICHHLAPYYSIIALRSSIVASTVLRAHGGRNSVLSIPMCPVILSMPARRCRTVVSRSLSTARTLVTTAACGACTKPGANLCEYASPSQGADGTRFSMREIVTMSHMALRCLGTNKASAKT